MNPKDHWTLQWEANILTKTHRLHKLTSKPQESQKTQKQRSPHLFTKPWHQQNNLTKPTSRIPVASLFFLCVSNPSMARHSVFFGGARRLKRSFPAFLNLWNTEESFELFSKRRLHCEAHPKSRRYRRFFCFDKQEKWSFLLGGSSQLVSG